MPEFLFFYLSLSRNPVCTQEQTGSRTYMSEKTAKRNEDNRSLHFHVANFFKFMATNLSFTQFVTCQASVLCITHRVFFLGVREDPFNGFLSALIELRVRRRISGIVRQLLIVLPDMPLHRFDTVLGMRTPFSGRTGGADIRIALVFPISITVRRAIFQGLVFGTYHAVVEFIIDILPPLVSILHGLRAVTEVWTSLPF